MELVSEGATWSTTMAAVDPEDAAGSSPRIPIADLPPLPDRGSGYWQEPWIGACVVSVICMTLVAIVTGVSLNRLSRPNEEDSHTLIITKTMLALIWVEALVAVLSTLYIVFGGAGVIRRSPHTCYPIPREVLEQLRGRGDTQLLHNNIKSNGRPGLPDGSYCVRCLVWRPPDGMVHHCSCCQRCVTGFDHHCGVFGRCIVKGNMTCFKCTIGMAVAGFLTVLVVVASGDEFGFVV